MKKFIKLIIILAILVVLILAGGLFYVYQNADSLITENKAKIEQKATEALKTPVSLGELDLKVFPNTKIDVDSLSLGKTAQTNGLTVNGITLDVAIMPLLKKKLEIVELSIDKPTITLLKTADGIQIEGLPAKQKVKKDTKEKKQATPDKTAKKTSQTKTSQFEVELKKFILNQATIKLIDKLNNKTQKIEGLTIGAGVKLEKNIAKLLDLSLAGNVQGLESIKAGAKEINFNTEKGILDLPSLILSAVDTELNLKANFDTKQQSGKASLTSTGVQLQSLASLAPAIKDLNLTGKVTPNIDIDIASKNQINANGKIDLAEIALSKGVLQLNAVNGAIDLDANQNKQTVKATEIKFNLGNQPGTLELNASKDGNNLSSTKIIKLFNGTIKSDAKLRLTADKDFSADNKINNLDLSLAHQAIMPEAPGKLHGTLNETTLDIRGNLKNLKPSLNGQGNLLLTNGSLKGTNLASRVLKVVTDLPFLTGSLLDAVPEELQGEVNGEDTPIRKLTIVFNIANQALNTTSLNLESTIFVLTGRGKIGFDQSLDLETEIVFSQKFSEALTLKVKEVEKVLDRDGQLVIPLKITGKVGDMKIIPNLKKLIEIGATKVVEDKLKEQANKLLEKKGFKLDKLDLGF